LTDSARILCWSPPGPALPFVTSRLTSSSTVDALRRALAEVVADAAFTSVRDRLFLEGVDLAPDAEHHRVLAIRRGAVELQYPVLH
jgi:hypothetical protein